VAALWMPKAQFDHAAHSTVLCTDCHKARQSRTSKDVLMPKIGTCRGCHGGEHASTALPSTCIMCHVYHRDNLRPMLPRAARASNFSR
jgi:predicted CXXCH cytochrome family protein